MWLRQALHSLKGLVVQLEWEIVSFRDALIGDIIVTV